MKPKIPRRQRRRKPPTSALTSQPGPRRLRGELRLPLLFLLVFGLFHWGYGHTRDTVVERVIIDMATVAPSAALIRMVSPAERVEAKGHRLVSPDVRLSVLNGCEGTESVFLLAAALLVYPVAWPQRLLGALLGAALLYGLNQVRIVGLYFAVRHDRELFNAIHGYLGPTLIVVLAGVFFVWWIGRAGTGSDESQVAP